MNPPLPFLLTKNHKFVTKYSWKRKGLICTEEELEDYYNEYIYLTNCDLCSDEFNSTRDRQMEHCHETGEFRNFVCRSCNKLKTDVKRRTDNTSGYVGINKIRDATCKYGVRYVFSVMLDKKRKQIKSMVNKEELIKFADLWKKANHYHT